MSCDWPWLRPDTACILHPATLELPRSGQLWDGELGQGTGRAGGLFQRSGPAWSWGEVRGGCWLWIWREPSSTLPVWPVGRLLPSHGSHVPGGETLKRRPSKKRNARQRRNEDRLSFISSLPVLSRKVIIPHQKDTARPKCPRRAILVPQLPFSNPLTLCESPWSNVTAEKTRLSCTGRRQEILT